jgi:hypothetical protein
MLLATILLLGALPQSGELARSVANVAAASVAEAADAKDSGAARELPSMPKPKVDSDAGADGVTANVVAAGSAAAGEVQPPSAALVVRPMKPAYTRPRETRGQRVAWYGLMAAGHGAAAFDAYSTRLAISGNYATETNPFLRPFSHSSALYAVTQLSPAAMDYIGKRMMASQDRWVRKLWWLPQAAGSGFSVFAGVHNLGMVK